MPFIVPNQAQVALKRPISTPTPWVRPADWLTIVDTPNECQFLVSSLGGGFYAITTTFTRPASQNLYIDWGDGVTDTISTLSTTTYHTYTTGGTPSSLGYDMWKIRVYTDAGATITACRFAPSPASPNTIYPSASNGLLEAYYGDGIGITNWNTYFLGNGAGGIGSSSLNFFNLQYAKLPATILGASTCTSIFSTCPSLEVVVMPTSWSGLTLASSMFTNSYNLQSITFPSNATAITDLGSTFSGCFNLTNVTLPPSLPSCTIIGSLFNNCYSLGSIQLPPLPVCISYASTFQGCKSLLSLDLRDVFSKTTALTYAMDTFMSNCWALNQVLYPAQFYPGTTVSNFNTSHQNNYTLQTITLPSNFNAASMNSTFANCSSLVSVSLPTTMPLLNTLQSAFSACYNLQSIVLPSGPTNISLSQTFTNCFSLGSVTIPSTYNPSTLASTFNNCYNLINLVLPPNCSNATSLNGMCSNCLSLETITMPTNLNGCGNAGNMFTGTYALDSVVFPATMNANTTFASCFSTSGVKSVTFPTSATLCTSFANMFQNATRIKNIVLPASVATTNTFAAMAQQVPTLESVTFPTTQTIGTTSIATAMLNSPNITGITNLDKIGNTSTASVVYVDGTNFMANTSSFSGTTDFYTKFSKLALNGTVTSRNRLTGLRLRNNGAGQYAGTSPQIDISYTNLSQAALVQVFNDLPTITSKTINITGASGAAALTAPERAIATGKGWTITG